MDMNRSKTEKLFKTGGAVSQRDDSMILERVAEVVASLDSDDPETVDAELKGRGLPGISEAVEIAERTKINLVDLVTIERKRVDEWLPAYHRSQEAQPELREVQSQLGVLQEEFRIAKEKFERDSKPLAVRRDELKDLHMQGIQARTRLANNPSATIKARTEPIRKKMGEAAGKKRAAKEVLEKAEALLRAEKQKPEYKQSEAEIDRLTERVQMAQSRVDAAQAAYAELDRQFSEIDRLKFELPKSVPQAVETVEADEQVEPVLTEAT